MSDPTKYDPYSPAVVAAWDAMLAADLKDLREYWDPDYVGYVDPAGLADRLDSVAERLVDDFCDDGGEVRMESDTGWHYLHGRGAARVDAEREVLTGAASDVRGWSPPISVESKP